MQGWETGWLRQSWLPVACFLTWRLYSPFKIDEGKDLQKIPRRTDGSLNEEFCRVKWSSPPSVGDWKSIQSVLFYYYYEGIWEGSKPEEQCQKLALLAPPAVLGSDRSKGDEFWNLLTGQRKAAVLKTHCHPLLSCWKTAFGGRPREHLEFMIWIRAIPSAPAKGFAASWPPGSGLVLPFCDHPVPALCPRSGQACWLFVLGILLLLGAGFPP